RQPRVAPFLSGGGGYLRQLHETATLVVTGRYYQFGGGVAYPLTSQSGGWLKTMGLRLEARAIIRVNGVAFDSSAHVAPTAGASFFLRVYGCHCPPVTCKSAPLASRRLMT